MKKKAIYWVEPVEYQDMGMWDGKSWHSEYGWSTARLSTMAKVRKMVQKYPYNHFRIEKILLQKGNRWHYTPYILKWNGSKISKLKESDCGEEI